MKIKVWVNTDVIKDFDMNEDELENQINWHMRDGRNDKAARTREGIRDMVICEEVEDRVSRIEYFWEFVEKRDSAPEKDIDGLGREKWLN